MVSMEKPSNQLLKYFKLVILFGLPVFLLILPADYFDHGESVCLSKSIFNMECYACGLTRAMQHLIHLDFSVAYEYNKLVVAVAPLLALLWTNYTLKTIGWRHIKWL